MPNIPGSDASVSYDNLKKSVKALKDYGPSFECNDTFAQSTYSKDFNGYVKKVNADMETLGLDKTEKDKISARLAAIYDKAEQDYNKAIKDPYFKFEEKEWKDAFTPVTKDLTDLASNPVGKVPAGKEVEFKQFADNQVQELGKFQKEKYNEEITRLDNNLKRRKENSDSHKLALEEAERLNYGIKNGQKHLFKETTASVTDEELKKSANDPALLGIMTEEEFAEKLKKMKDSKGKLYVGQDEPYKGRLFEWTKDGCRPQPPVKDGNYKAEYGGAIDLLKLKEPECSEVIFFIPIFSRDGRPPSDRDLKFIDEKYVKNKITSVFEASRERGVPMKLDEDLRTHLISLLSKEKEGSGLRKEINKLLDLEIAMEKKSERDKLVGKDKDQMEVNVDRMTATLDRMPSLDVADYKAALEDEIKAEPADPAKRDEIIVKKLNEIEAQRAELTKAGKMIDLQRVALQDHIDREDKDNTTFANRNPFLTEHIQKLEKLAELQEKKLKALDERAQVVNEKAKTMPVVAARSQKCVDDIKPMLGASNHCSEKVKEYTKERAKEQQQVAAERKGSAPGKNP